MPSEKDPDFGLPWIVSLMVFADEIEEVGMATFETPPDETKASMEDSSK